MRQPTKATPWTTRDLKAVLDQETRPEATSAIDPLGLDPARYGAMQGAVTAETILALLAEAQAGDGEDRIALVIDLLTNQTALLREINDLIGAMLVAQAEIKEMLSAA